MSQAIVLVGLRCAGKSSGGRCLADELGLPFVDLDEGLAALEGGARSAGELFGELGEPAFRELEARALADCTSRGALVLATGGGVVERDGNIELLRSLARVVWLDAPDEVLLARRSGDESLRPLLAGEDPAQELELIGPRRRPLYRSLAGAPVDTSSMDVAALAENLAAGLRNEIGRGD